MTEIIFSTASELAKAIHDKQISATEALDAHLECIAKHDPPLNSIVTLYEETARKRAREADEALARGEIWGPLHGVPVTLKAVHSVAGVPSPWGVQPDSATRIPSEDSAMPAKLRQAGSVILGLTNTPLIDSNIYGRTNNPWDVERSPDGSSSGAAAAVAAGLSPLDIGTDAFGSVLNPASFCGVFGMRPTEHRVSNAGSKVLGTPHTFIPITVSGPITRSVEDLELALQVISGPDGRDMDVPPIPWRKATGVRLPGLRLAWSHTFPKMPIAKDIHDSVESLVAELGSLGVHVEQTMPELDYVKARDLGWQFVVFAWGEFFATPDAPPVKLDDFYKAVARREELVRIWEQFFTQWDVFLCPTKTYTANLHTDTGLIIDGKAYTQEEVSESPRSISPLTGFPSVTIPVGLDSQGLPIGLQLIGRRWEDERLLAIAKLVAEVTGGFKKPPGY